MGYRPPWDGVIDISESVAASPADVYDRMQQLCDDVLWVLAHDLRNPLSIVMMGAGILAVRGAEHGDPRCDSIMLAVERMEQLIRNVLDLAALMLGERQLACAPHALDSLMADVCRQPVVRSLERPAHVAHVPETPCWLHVDAGLMVPALAGLMLAAAALGHGELIWRIRQVDGWVRMTVSAQATGWDPAYAGLLDQPIRNRECQVPGTGLSLSLARAVVEAHGGTLAIEPVSEMAGGLVARLPAGEPPATELLAG